VSIGEVLGDARCRLGLSVSEVSRRTRIRAAIIWAIQQDDFSQCGGDFYARGHIRAIARTVGVDPAPLIEEYDATVRETEDVTSVVVLHPAAPSGTARRGRIAWITALGLAALAIVGWTAYHFATATGHPPGSTAVAAADTAPAHHQASPSTPRPSPSPTHSTAPAVPRTVPVRALKPVSVAAFGPGGTAQGDDPRHAGRAIDGHSGTAWLSDWYTTPAFGNLQAGTGLLLNMGRPVTITAVRIRLGGLPGADLQLRAGNVPALADLREVASAADAGVIVHMRSAAPVRARYVLIWFTRLPPGTSGTFRASVSDVALEGQR
jgi:hypothetical protein